MLLFLNNLCFLGVSIIIIMNETILLSLQMCIIKNIEKKHETMKNVAANVLLKTLAKTFLYFVSDMAKGRI